MKIDFKLITEKEVPEILLMMEEFYSIDEYPFDEYRTRENLMIFISDQYLGRIWIITFDNLTIGYVVLTFGFSFEHNGKDAFIDELFIKSNFRKKGIGSLTMDFIQKEGIKLGINVVHLEVEQHNINGTKLYRKKGYIDSGRILLSKKIMNH